MPVRGLRAGRVRARGDFGGGRVRARGDFGGGRVLTTSWEFGVCSVESRCWSSSGITLAEEMLNCVNHLLKGICKKLIPRLIMLVALIACSSRGDTPYLS